MIERFVIALIGGILAFIGDMIPNQFRPAAPATPVLPDTSLLARTDDPLFVGVALVLIAAAFAVYTRAKETDS